MRPVLVLLALALAACTRKAPVTYELDALPAEHLTFSYGGGFTGEWNDYLLLANGQLFHRRRVINAVPFRAYDPIDAKVAKELFTSYKKQDFGELGFDDPGNMSYTIQSISATDTTHVTWGGTEVKPSEELRSYWRRAMNSFEGKKALPVVK